jgi:heme exporter protein A
MAEPTSELAIDASGVARRFGTRWVLRGVSVQVRAGEAVGLLGANGSGKSTLLRILGTLLRPSAGSARVYGHDVVRAADQVRAVLGFLAHTPGLYDDLTARENLRFAATMLGLTNASVDAVLARVGLSQAADERVRAFSAGMERRLAVARMLLAKPRLLLLDEPYSNLDAEGIAMMSGIITDAVRGGGAAVVVLHELAPAAGILNRAVTLRDGRA